MVETFRASPATANLLSSGPVLLFIENQFVFLAQSGMVLLEPLEKVLMGELNI